MADVNLLTGEGTDIAPPQDQPPDPSKLVDAGPVDSTDLHDDGPVPMTKINPIQVVDSDPVLALKAYRAQNPAKTTVGDYLAAAPGMAWEAAKLPFTVPAGIIANIPSVGSSMFQGAKAVVKAGAGEPAAQAEIGGGIAGLINQFDELTSGAANNATKLYRLFTEGLGGLSNSTLPDEALLAMLRDQAAQQRVREKINQGEPGEALRETLLHTTGLELGPQTTPAESRVGYNPEEAAGAEMLLSLPVYNAAGRLLPAGITRAISQAALSTMSKAAGATGATVETLFNNPILRTASNHPWLNAILTHEATGIPYHAAVAMGLGLRAVPFLGEAAGSGFRQIAGLLGEAGTRLTLSPEELMTLRGLETEAGPNLAQRLFMRGAQAATTGAVGMAPLMAAAQSPEEAKQILEIGAAFGLAGEAGDTFNRAALNAGLGARSAILNSMWKTRGGVNIPLSADHFEYGTPEDALHAQAVSNMKPEDIANLNMQRHALQGMAKVYVLSPEAFDTKFPEAKDQAFGLVDRSGKQPEIYYRGDVGFQNAQSHEPLHIIRENMAPADRTELDKALLKLNDPSTFASQYYSAKYGTPISVNWDDVPDRVADAKDPYHITKQAIMDEMTADSFRKLRFDQISKDPNLQTKIKQAIGKTMQDWGMPMTTQEVQGVFGATPSFQAMSILENAIRNMAERAVRAGPQYGAKPAEPAPEPVKPETQRFKETAPEEPAPGTQAAPPAPAVPEVQPPAPGDHLQEIVSALRGLDMPLSEARARAMEAVTAAHSMGIQPGVEDLVYRALGGKFPPQIVPAAPPAAEAPPEPARGVVGRYQLMPKSNDDLFAALRQSRIEEANDIAPGWQERNLARIRTRRDIFTALNDNYMKSLNETGKAPLSDVVMINDANNLPTYAGEQFGIQPLSMMPAVPGGDVTEALDSYGRGKEKTGNVWVRQTHSDHDNSNRVLAVQISSDLMQPPTLNAVDEAAQRYYETLYSGARKGYVKPSDFWEIPDWMSQVTHNLGDRVDAYVVRDMNEARNFLHQAGYGDVLFSVMDANKPMVAELARDYKGQVSLGAYTDTSDIPNATRYESMKDYVESKGLTFTPGKDFRLFKDTDTIPRLTMSEGCRHGCRFCVLAKTPIREAAPGEIGQQVESFKDLNANLVYINDKTFGQATNFQRLPELFQQLKEQNPDFQGFIIQTTAAQMQRLPEDFLKQAGVKYIELGVESYNDSVLKNQSKPANEALIDAATEKIRRVGAKFIPNIMIGLPGETAETYAHTMDFLRRNSDVISHTNTYNLAIYDQAALSKEIAASAEGDRNENIAQKSFYTDQSIHERFAKDVYDFSTGQLQAQQYMPSRIIGEAYKTEDGYIIRGRKQLATLGQSIQGAQKGYVTQNGQFVPEDLVDKKTMTYDPEELYKRTGQYMPASYLGEVTPEGEIKGSPNYGESHERLGFTSGKQWRYLPEDKQVIWWQPPSEQEKGAVDQWLQNKGQEATSHNDIYAKFMPIPNDPDAINVNQPAAIQTPDGEIWKGKWHPEAYSNMTANYTPEQLGKWSKEYGGDNYFVTGYMTNAGDFVTPEEARKIVESKGQMTQHQLDMMESIEGRQMESMALRKAATAPRTLNEIIDSHNSSGGSTTDINTMRPHTPEQGRYVVSVDKSREQTLDHPMSSEDLAAYVRQNRPVLQEPGSYLGTWKGPEGDVLDISRATDDFQEALRLARDNNQESIWDSQEQKLIPTVVTPGRTGAPGMWDSLQTAGHADELAGQLGVDPKKRFYEQKPEAQKAITDYFKTQGAQYMPGVSWTRDEGQKFLNDNTSAFSEMGFHPPEIIGSVGQRGRGRDLDLLVRPSHDQFDYEGLAEKLGASPSEETFTDADGNQHAFVQFQFPSGKVVDLFQQGDIDNLPPAPKGFVGSWEKQYMPSSHPDAIEEAAIITPDGVLFTGAYHQEAYDKALAAGSDLTKGISKDGWITKTGRFLTPKQALQHAYDIGQANVNEMTEARRKIWGPKNPPPYELESTTFKRARQYMPAVSDIGFYSQLEKAAEERLPNRATKDQILATLRKAGGVKENEIKWVLGDFLERNPNPTKQELLDHIRANAVTVQEVAKGGEAQISRELRNAIQFHNTGGVPNSNENWAKFANRLENIGRQWQRNGDTRKADQYFELATQATDISEGLREGSMAKSPKYEASHLNLPGYTPGTYRELLETLPPTSDATRINDLRKELQSIDREIRAMEGIENTDEIFSEREQIAKQLSDAESATSAPTFTSSHWSEPNVIAHSRVAEYKTPDGKPILVSNEFQSDWAQHLRQHGESQEQEALNQAYRDAQAKALEMGYTTTEPAGMFASSRWWQDPSGKTVAEITLQNRGGQNASGTDDPKLQFLVDAFKAAVANKNAPPDMPFKSTDAWTSLLLKRMIKYAVDNGYDRIGWTTGDQQAERYDLGKQVQVLEVHKDGRLYDLSGIPTNSTEFIPLAHKIQESDLSRYVGKEMAQKILNNEHIQAGKPISYSGLDLSIGGEGMKAYYDNIVPKVANQIGKQFGTKVEPGQIQFIDPRPPSTNTQGMYLSEFRGQPVIKNRFGQTFKGLKDGQAQWADTADGAKLFDSTDEAEKAMEDAIAAENPQVTRTETIHTLPIPPEMANTVQEKGQPLFMPKPRGYTWDQVSSLLDPEQLASIRPAYQRKIVNSFKKLSLEKGVTYAKGGQEGRYWYRDMVDSIHNLFGSDVPEYRSDPDRFAALLAALSPNRPTDANLTHALQTWNLWEEAGRPTDKNSIEDIVMQGNEIPGAGEGKFGRPKGQAIGSFGSMIPNAFRVLSADDPSTIKLSGPKVDSFYSNLRGDVNRVTNDRHMGKYAYGSEYLGRRVSEGRIIEGFRGLALSAHIRQVAQELTKRTGETWTPSEVQAAIWTYQIPLAALASAMDMTPEEFLAKGYNVTKKDLQKVPSFVKLLQHEANQPAIESIRGRRGSNPIPEINPGPGFETEVPAGPPGVAIPSVEHPF